jgi:hypothetical protein
MRVASSRVATVAMVLVGLAVLVLASRLVSVSLVDANCWAVASW